jgi:superoxide dismutase
MKSWNGGKPTPEFNNAGQVVNHTFFWESMRPNAGGERATGFAAVRTSHSTTKVGLSISAVCMPPAQPP